MWLRIKLVLKVNSIRGQYEFCFSSEKFEVFLDRVIDMHFEEQLGKKRKILELSEWR